MESCFAWISFLVTIKAQCFNKSAFIFHCFMTRCIICLTAQLMRMWCKCVKYWIIHLISNRHNPKNNTFTSVYETPVNINAKKQSEAFSEVRFCLRHRLTVYLTKYYSKLTKYIFFVAAEAMKNNNWLKIQVKIFWFSVTLFDVIFTSAQFWINTVNLRCFHIEYNEY